MSRKKVSARRTGETAARLAKAYSATAAVAIPIPAHVNVDIPNSLLSDLEIRKSLSVDCYTLRDYTWARGPSILVTSEDARAIPALPAPAKAIPTPNYFNSKSPLASQAITLPLPRHNYFPLLSVNSMYSRRAM
ncbi:hypothetical protein [Pontibacter sp. HSC-36F09]|uniref:hypothetical protein n=1 Tax=Pontibacter sp. HSC-36F09 TaxID=2910966 RepID=UPI00209C8F4D|nr:hypothetical protein [Pontibacter sp. HSC-36F09]MCP2042680.1 hypothetical protein [Pontibacter sp. HSC-36F09]